MAAKALPQVEDDREAGAFLPPPSVEIVVVGRIENGNSLLEKDKGDEKDVFDTASIQAASVPNQVTTADIQPAEKSRLGIALAAMAIYVTTSVADQQFLKNSFSEDFYAPFFIYGLANVLRIWSFPVFLVLMWIIMRSRRRPRPVSELASKYSLFRGSKLPLWADFVKRIGILTGLIIIAMVLNTTALSYASASDIGAVHTTQVALVYFFAVVFLKHKVLLLKVLAVIVSLGGVALIAYAKGFGSSSALGIGIGFLSTIIFSVNINVFKFLFPKLNFGQTISFLSWVAFSALTLYAWLPISAYYSGVDVWYYDAIPWENLIPHFMCAWAMATSVNYALTLSSPLLVSFGSLLRIPLNLLVDYFLRGTVFTSLELVGCGLIVLGFLVIVLPDNRVSLRLRPVLRRSASK
ncbi:hypothetical protein RvY_04689 [Ramazzottius varieornatus]|uniref:EamA domain-containing protein n=1 Tax=Ramazzottius varieornatus TaxID=947166 RepID=A0A1D1USI7_RAMVA|nr:hypothetical protein RvY_04689 [Ramazzottius varieornatus]